jgi:hypothetical protein
MSRKANLSKEDEEEEILKRNRQMWAHFVVVCFLTSSRLVKTLDEIRRKFRTDQQMGDAFAPLQHFLFGYSVQEKKKMAAQYWDPNVKASSSNMTERELGSSLKIQAFLRHVVLTKKLVRLHPSVAVSEMKVEILQSAVRAWHYKRVLLEKAKKKYHEENLFHAFCMRMLDGVDVYMFGKKYGGMPLRTVKITRDGEYLIYKTRFINQRRWELNTIYDVVKGHSGFPYPRAKPVHRSWCLHLRLLGGKIIDMEAQSSADYMMLYSGFCRLRFLLSTKAPFFIDQFGTACRAGPSVVTNAISHVKGTSKENNAKKSKAEIAAEEKDDAGKRERSEADKWRYFAALQTLNKEYAICAHANNDGNDEEEKEAAEDVVVEELLEEAKMEELDDDDVAYARKADVGPAPEEAASAEVEVPNTFFRKSMGLFSKKEV